MQLLEVVTGHSQFLSHFSIPQAMPTQPVTVRLLGRHGMAGMRSNTPCRATAAALLALAQLARAQNAGPLIPSFGCDLKGLQTVCHTRQVLLCRTFLVSALMSVRLP